MVPKTECGASAWSYKSKSVCHQQGREVWVVKFQGVDTPEAAQALGGQVLLAMPEEHGDLEEDEFYVQVFTSSVSTQPIPLGWGCLCCLS